MTQRLGIHTRGISLALTIALLVCAANGRSTSGGLMTVTSYQWVGGTEGHEDDWFTSTNWDPKGVPGASDHVTLEEADVVVSRKVDIGTLTLNTGSTLRSTATITIHRLFEWTGGELVGRGTTVITSGARAELSGPAKKSLMEFQTLENRGKITWQEGEFYVSEAALVNHSQFVIAGDEHLEVAGASKFRNLAGATILKRSQSDTKFAVSLDHSGTIDVQAGILTLAENHKFLAGSHVVGSGKVVVGGENIAGVDVTGVALIGGPKPGMLEISGHGVLGGTGDLRVERNGSLVWTGGGIEGKGRVTVTSGATLRIEGNEPGSLSERTILNQGTIVYRGTGAIAGENGAEIVNHGVIRVENDANVAVGRLFNAPSGTLTKTVATGTSDFTAMVFLDSGTVDIRSGEIEFPGGRIIRAGTRVAQASAVSGTPGARAEPDPPRSSAPSVAAPAQPVKAPVTAPAPPLDSGVPSFQPKQITTPELAMTGMRFRPKQITTAELAMTGMRFQPKQITTPELVMTGMRFQPKKITTDALVMTGLRQVP